MPPARRCRARGIGICWRPGAGGHVSRIDAVVSPNPVWAVSAAVDAWIDRHGDVLGARDAASPRAGRQNLGAIHGAAILLTAVTMLLGFTAGAMYLVQARRLKHKRPVDGGLRLPSLEWLQRECPVACGCAGAVGRRNRGRHDPGSDRVSCRARSAVVARSGGAGHMVDVPLACRGRGVQFLRPFRPARA